MRYVSKPAELSVSPMKLRLRRRPAGAVGTPQDLGIDGSSSPWFTGTRNALGVFFKGEGPLVVVPRTTGVRPRRLLSALHSPLGRDMWFLDTEARTIGSVETDGTDGKWRFVPEVQLGPGVTPTALAESLIGPLVVGTDAGVLHVIDYKGHATVECPHQRIDGVGWGPDRALWCASGSTLQPYHWETRIWGLKLDLPEGARIDELVAANHDYELYYCDARRNVVGWMKARDEGEERLIEYQLPEGVAPRAVAAGRSSSPWFTGRGGRSLFHLEHGRCVEFACEDPSADLNRLAYVWDDTMWFTEPRANSITTASLAGY